MSTSDERHPWLNHRTELPLLLLVLGAIILAGATGFLRSPQSTTHLSLVQAIRLADQPNRVGSIGNMVLVDATSQAIAWNANNTARNTTVWVVELQGDFVHGKRASYNSHCRPECSLGTMRPLPTPYSTSGSSIVQPLICPNAHERRYQRVTVYINDSNGKWLKTRYTEPVRYLPPVLNVKPSPTVAPIIPPSSFTGTAQ